MRKPCSLALLLLIAVPVFSQDSPDYRSRTIYFLLTDRFYPHQPYDPYIDPLFPDAIRNLVLGVKHRTRREDVNQTAARS